MATTIPIPTHKRTSSAAGNGNETPGVKRQATVGPNFAPLGTSAPQAQEQAQGQLVYIVMVECSPQYLPEITDIRDVFASMEDANNAARRIISDGEYSAVEESEAEHGTHPDGTVWWATNDAGEGESVYVSVKPFELKPPGSEPTCDWGNGEENTDQQSVDA